jgi:hypothetical protein
MASARGPGSTFFCKSWKCLRACLSRGSISRRGGCLTAAAKPACTLISISVRFQPRLCKARSRVGVSWRKRVACAAAGTATVMRCLSMSATRQLKASTGGSARRMTLSASIRFFARANTLDPISSVSSHCKAWVAGRFACIVGFLRIRWVRVRVVFNPE